MKWTSITEVASVAPTRLQRGFFLQAEGSSTPPLMNDRPPLYLDSIRALYVVLKILTLHFCLPNAVLLFFSSSTSSLLLHYLPRCHSLYYLRSLHYLYSYHCVYLCSYIIIFLPTYLILILFYHIHFYSTFIIIQQRGPTTVFHCLTLYYMSVV